MGPQGVTPSAPPAQLKPSVRKMSYTAIIAAGIFSLSLNIYHDITGGNLPGIIAVMAGFIAPFLCAILAHVAAELNFSLVFKVLVFGVVGAMMYVSASSGVSVLEHVMKAGPAYALALGADATAMICLGVLMEDGNRRKALEEWNRAETARREQAERDEIAARYGRTPRRETPGGNTRGNGGGNTGGNSLPGAGGNTGPGQDPAAVVPPGSSARPGDGDGAEVLDLDSRRSSARRESMSEDEIRKLAESMASDLAKIGEEISVRKFTDQYGGTPRRVGPIVSEVKARFAEAKKSRESGPSSAEAR